MAIETREKRPYTKHRDNPSHALRLKATGSGPLFEIQKALNIRQSELAERLGIPASNLSTFQNAGRFPERATYRNWEALKQVTQEALDLLVKRDDDESKAAYTIIETAARATGFFDDKEKIYVLD